MQIAERVAGMPPEEGDLLRRSLRKEGRRPGPPRASSSARPASAATRRPRSSKLWKTMEKFSSYSFNKAHSASYAAMAYQAVYLKVHHPVPYLAAVLNAGGGYYDLAEYVEEAKRQGIRILGPDANRSGHGFEVEGGAIRVGFDVDQGAGAQDRSKILDERAAGGEFPSVEDFLARTRARRKSRAPGAHPGRRLRRARAAPDAPGPPLFPGARGHGARWRTSTPAEKAADALRVARLPRRRATRSTSTRASGRRSGSGTSRPAPGRSVELVVRVVDARQIPLKGGSRYFFLFEDETGLVEGIGETRGLVFGTPPACCLRGEVRNGGGGVKIQNCSFLRSF